jgi:hypothetical protein
VTIASSMPNAPQQDSCSLAQRQSKTKVTSVLLLTNGSHPFDADRPSMGQQKSVAARRDFRALDRAGSWPTKRGKTEPDHELAGDRSPHHQPRGIHAIAEQEQRAHGRDAQRESVNDGRPGQLRALVIVSSRRPQVTTGPFLLHPSGGPLSRGSRWLRWRRRAPDALAVSIGERSHGRTWFVVSREALAGSRPGQLDCAARFRSRHNRHHESQPRAGIADSSGSACNCSRGRS